MRAPLIFFMMYTIFLIKYCLMALAPEINEADRSGLVALKDAITSEPDGIFKSWNSSFHYCQWQGVSCSTKHPERVTSLNLSSHELVGHLTPHIGNLSFLKNIILYNNSFHGEIPQEIGKLFRLEILRLDNNSFDGEIPRNLTGCTRLWLINFYGNNLNSKIPVELGYLHNVEVLNLGVNNFQGQIPPSLGNLSSLYWLNLAESNLFGIIPDDLGRLTRLERLILEINNLTGTIPSSIFNLSRLAELSVVGNRLEGKLPSNMGINLPNLENLYFGGNSFTGSIPTSLSNASHLRLFDFGQNMFSGEIPVELGKLVNLYIVGLGYNMFGTKGGNVNDFRVISYLTNCTELRSLDLSNNVLRGRLPESIANLSIQINYLKLGYNQIYGTIPSGIGNLLNLNFLDLSYMMLHGNVPSEIGKLRSLVRLYIYGNKLTGPIPPTLGNFTMITDLALYENNLTGTIPSSLGKCQTLLNLLLQSNNLRGSIPLSIFSIPSLLFLGLSHNSFTGSLPPDVGNVKQLIGLDVSTNYLSGVIPNELGSILSLEYMYLYNNSLSGTIPQSLSDLKGLVKIDLSHNNLSGKIPEYLGGFPFLQVLNLSFNNFEGAVPTTNFFRNSSVTSLIGNKNLCGGTPEFKLPACIVHGNKARGMPSVLKVVIPLIVVVVFVSLLGIFYYLWCSRNKSEQNPQPETVIDNQFLQISYQELVHATNGFSDTNLVGFGSYGSVYKGFLHQSQSVIAVKVFNLQHKGASKSFISECKALKHIRHRNLLKIVSVCSSVDNQGNDFKAVIYELMSKGSLESWLHPQEVAHLENEMKKLTFKQRLDIVIDVATAVEYLHYDCIPPIVHGDLKPSNVLLDKDMVAHVGDFGLAKVLSKVTDNQSTSDIIKGSIGYAPPEYGVGKGASIEGDVYSFGILVLEIFTATRPTDDMFQGNLNLHNFCRMALQNSVMDVVDPLLLQPEKSIAKKVEDCLASVLRIGVSCSIQTPKNRMQIRNALRELHLIKTLYEREGISITE